MLKFIKSRSLKNLCKGIRHPKLIADYFYNNYLFAFIPKRIRSRKLLGAYQSYSQAYQDVFVREMLERKRCGLYVEVGAYDEIDHSNTYILETQYEWSGFSIEIEKQAASDFNEARKNKCICIDATLFNFEKYFKEQNFPSKIDYLSLDIEPAMQTLKVLKNIPLDRYRFSVITYEHDRYVSGPEYMIESRKIFESYGYKLVASNICWDGRDFEDWYVDPSIVPEAIWSRYLSNNIDCLEIFKRSGIA